MTTSAAPTRASGPTAPHRLTAEERRAEITEAAVTAFASGGLAGTSTEEIARLAGVSQPYLFRLFGTKRELFLAAVDRMFERILATFEEAALHPRPVPPGWSPVLASMGHAYGELLADRELLNVAAAMDLTDADVAWQRICEEGPA